MPIYWAGSKAGGQYELTKADDGRVWIRYLPTSAKIGEQAATSTISLEQLQKAFDNVYATIDQIDSYKVQALDNMKKTVDALSTQVDKAQSYLQRAKQPAADAGELTLPALGTGGGAGQ